MSIRIRLIVWHSTVFALGLAGFAVVIWLATRAAVGNDIDTWLTRQADGLEHFLQLETHGTNQAAVVEEAREFSSGLPKGSGIQLFDRNGRLLLSRPEVTIGLASEQPTNLMSEQSHLRALTRRSTVAGEQYKYTLWRSVDETNAALDDLRLVLLLLAPSFLALSLIGGWFLSRRALRPVDEITQAARRISLQNLSGSLPIPSHRDELQRLCLAWNEMLSRLDASARQLSQFTADASHELRTPLALIRTTAELALRQERSIADYQSSLRRIEEEARELTQVLESLMELARADSGQSTFSLVPVDVRDVVSEIRTHVESISAASRLDLAVNLPETRLTVLADRGLLRRLLLVLLDNAMKFTAPPGRVNLRASETAAEVVLEVEDSGIGIANHDLARIFDRFYQADESRSGKGVGLGLSIAQWIVQGHHGRIEVKSNPGSGSTFRVFLPAVR